MSPYTVSRTVRSALITAAAGAASTLAVAAPPSNSPYFTDAQSSHVQDATSESIGQVNMITCVFSSMRPDALVNQGAYIALVDQNKCDAAKQSSAAGASGSSGATQAPNYMTAIVDSTRASNADPMVVKAWITLNEDGNPVTIFAHVSATAAPSASDPYGTFRLDYCGKAGGTGSCLMNGYIQAGNGTLSYFEADSGMGGGGGGGGGGSQTTALQLSSVGTTSGSGSLDAPDDQGGQVAFDFAYDQSYFLRSTTSTGGTTQQCFNRDATAPGTGISVWQYGLYDATTGARIARNSGFPIQYTGGDGNTYQGYVGYYGLNSQPGAPSPADGSTVQKVDYSSNGATTASYAVVSKGGRLARFTQQTTTLKAIDQIDLTVFLNDAAGSGLPDSNTQYVMHWDEGSQKLVATAEMACGQNGCQTSTLSPAIQVDPTFFAPRGLQGWSQSMGGGDVFVALNTAGTPLDTTVVSYHVQDLVYPDDANLPATLYCVSNCPTAQSLQAYFTQGSGGTVQSPYLSTTYQSWQPTTAPVSYTLSGNVLVDGNGAPVVFTDASAYQSYPQYQSGVMGGRMVANLADAQCGTDSNNNPQYCDWTISSAQVYYQWQTGPNSWSQFTALKDANNAFVHFDAPLNVKFVVPANSSGSGASGFPYGTYAGTTMVLQYADFGDLWGIPGSCVSSTTNQPVDCTNDPTVRYVPAFAIPFDQQQGVVTAGSGNSATSYLVKWLNREIRFAQEPVSTCTGDGLSASSATLPDSSGLKDPSDPSSPVYNGTEPTVTGAPRVIQGTVEY